MERLYIIIKSNPAALIKKIFDLRRIFGASFMQTLYLPLLLKHSPLLFSKADMTGHGIPYENKRQKTSKTRNLNNCDILTRRTTRSGRLAIYKTGTNRLQYLFNKVHACFGYLQALPRHE